MLFFIIGKMASRVAFGPRAVVWSFPAIKHSLPCQWLCCHCDATSKYWN